MMPLNISEIKSELGKVEIDYFITSASFEERCFELYEGISGYNSIKVLVFGTTDFDSKIEENRTRICNIFNNKSHKTEIVDLSISNPEFSFINMVRVCQKLFKGSPKRLLLDITTFTHEGLLILFQLLLTYKRSLDEIYIIYVGVNTYSHDALDNNEKWLTKGVKELRSIIGYPGYSDPSKKNHLIVLMGFEKERTMRLIEEFDFERVSIAFGSKSDSINIKHQTINEIRLNEILELYSNAKKFELSLTDPYLAKEQILSHVSNYKNFNTVIAPMNNKISTIGAGLAAIDNKEIQLFYMQANIYNIQGYSDFGDSYYFQQLKSI